MFIGDTLHASAFEGMGTLYYSAWFDRGGNGAEFVCNVINTIGIVGGGHFKITVQTKNSEDSDDLATSFAANTIGLGTMPANVTFSAGAQVGSGSAGFKELVRFEYDISGATAGTPAWMHFRMLNPSWITY